MDNWKHRSKDMCCRTCMWSVIKERADQRELAEGETAPPIIGRCRKRAPTMNGYPVIFMTDWCGDHKLDENSI